MADANERPAPAEKAPRRLQPTLISGAIPRSSPDPSESDSPPPFPTLPEGSGSKSFFDYLLQRYPPNEDVEDALPIFGESGSEFEYDSETRQEIEDEMRGAPGPLELAEEEFNAIVDEHIADRETLFMTTRLPKQQHKAFAIWSEGNNNPDVIENYSQELEYFEQRLRAEREALAGAHHSTRRDLLDACPCMNITISAICLKKWQLSIVKQNEAPKKIAPPPRDTKAAKARVHANGDESLDSDSGSDSGSVWMDEDEEEKRDDPEIDAGPDHLQERAGPGKLSETEECVISPDESRKRSSSAFRNGPFRDSSSSDESLDQFMIDEHEHVELATKRRRMKGTNPDETDLASSAIPLQGLMPGQDLPLPSTEGPADVEMETRIDTANRPQYRTHQSLNPNSGDIDENDDALNAFVEVSSIMWESIEQNGDRFYLLAKALSCLTKSRAEQFSKFLAESLPFIYQDIARDALIAISEDESAIEAMNPEQSHLAMLLATLFISWVNKLRIPDEAIPTEQVKIALAVVTEDTGEDGFTPFWDSLNDLLEGYLRWHSLPREVQSKKKKIEPRRQRRTMKLISKRITMNRAQEEGQQRQDLQDAAKRALLDSRLTEGIAFSNITDYPVSFRDPIIYLDPHISKFIKNHQLLGIQFLFREIAENKEPEGCLLAHTMGLGKTMQVISLLVTISKAGASHDLAIRDQIPNELRQSKTLILCPAALVENWRNEFAMWSPGNHNLGKISSIPGKTTKGPGSDRDDIIRLWKDEGGVLIISYSIFRNLAGDNAHRGQDPAQKAAHDTVKGWLLNSPTLVVADEAQMLRTQGSQIAATASRFRTQKRIALTGTPISNGLKDYYWMVDWVAPKYLGSFPEFKDCFIKPIEAGSHTESSFLERRIALRRQELLFRIIGPKVQRMDMSALSADLPPKYEFSIYFELTNLQKFAYNLFVQAVRDGNAENVSQKLMSWLNLLQLCCNHPALFKQQLESRNPKPAHSEQTGLSNYTGPSGDNHNSLPGSNMPTEEPKLRNLMLSELNNLFKDILDPLDPHQSNRVRILDEILNYSISVGDKVLVFSSSIPTLNYLGQFMDRTKRKYSRIDGTVTAADRYEMMKKFNNDPTINVFLISTHAGGLGLNLQTANRVVIFDFMFNPTWEEQAVGRAYRIGQKKPVFVYRLVAATTFEERVYGMAIFKSQLARRLVDHKNVTREGSRSRRDYLAPCTESSHDDDIDIIAVAKDPGMMGRLTSTGCAQQIVSIKLSSDEIDPTDSLTSAERRTVDHELQMRRLRLSGSAVPAIIPMVIAQSVPENPAK